MDNTISLLKLLARFVVCDVEFGHERIAAQDFPVGRCDGLSPRLCGPFNPLTNNDYKFRGRIASGAA